MVQFQRQAERLAEGLAPAGEIPDGLAIDARQRGELLPACLRQPRRDRLGEAAVGGEAAIPEPKHGDRDLVHLVDAGEEPRRRRRRRAIAVGGRQQDQRPCRRHRACVVHRAEMDPAPCGCQRLRQRRGEAPGGAALRARQDDDFRLCHGDGAGYARARGAPLPPDPAAGARQDRRGRRRGAQEQAEPPKPLAGVQPVGPFPDALRRRVRLPVQQGARHLVDVSGAVGGLKAEYVGGVAGRRPGEPAQVPDANLPQRSQGSDRGGRGACHDLGKDRGVGATVADDPERRQRHPHAGQRRDRESGQRRPADHGMPAVRP